MPKLGQLFKSKTVDFNILAGAITTILGAAGVSIPANVVMAVFVVMNVILRIVTKKPLTEK
jgi:hypothetical protein